jgi:LacI family transcriptional regulator
MTMLPTRADVARLANVSTATVSYVVNDGPRPVAPATRERVLAAIAQLGYRPNAVARSLVRQRTHALGLIVPDNANPFFAEFARCVEDRAFAQGYTVALCNTNLDLRREAAYLDLLLDKRVDGVIVTSSTLTRAQLGLFVERRVPLVIVDPQEPDLGFDTVRVDDTAGSRRATSHLIEHGYSSIACLAGPRGSPGAMRRLAGFEEAMLEAGRTVREDFVLFGPFSAESGYERALELLGRRDRPRSIFAEADLLAIGAMRAAWELGLRVPEDLAIVGFDDIVFANLTTPPLTTVAQPLDVIADHAVALLLERLKRERDLSPPRDRLIKAEMVVRASCGCGGTRT